MSTIIKTIKNKLTNNTIYPITKADAVYLNDNVTTVESIIGNTSITGIGNGTITDIVSTLHTNVETLITNLGTFKSQYIVRSSTVNTQSTVVFYFGKRGNSNLIGLFSINSGSVIETSLTNNNNNFISATISSDNTLSISTDSYTDVRILKI